MKDQETRMKGEEKAREDETGYRNKGEKRREQVGDMEGPGKGDEQEVDETRKRKNTATTVESWGYDWLHFEKDKKGYVTKVWCCICREHYKKRTAQHIYIHNTDTYITGSTNVKKCTTKTHINSKAHITACQQTNQAPINSNTVTQLQELNDKTETKMCKLFDIAYTVAYTEQPFSL
ncbi:hypothetical protein ABVT39_009832 [Epinephelus coioides]